jgi:hypothetical protein
VLPTVSSMLEHKDVMSWYKKIPQGRINRFLGITKENVPFFKNLSKIEKCVWRWRSHKEELSRLKNILSPERFMVINYEAFMSSPESHLEKLASFIKIDNLYEFENLKVESLEKWQSVLTPIEIRSVRSLASQD